MDDHLLDELARSLAGPVPRRRAVRLIAGAVAAVLVPAARPRAARAAGNPNCPGTSCPHPNGGCAPNLKPCPYGCCSKNDSCCVGAKDSIGNLQVACCPPGASCCGSGTPTPQCCGKGEKCQRGKCVSECPPGREECGDKCCGEEERCTRLNKTRICCPNQWDACIAPEAGKGVCCKPSEKCCFTKTKASCCGPGQKCVKGVCTCESGRPCGDTCCPKGRACCSFGGAQYCCPAGWECVSALKGERLPAGVETSFPPYLVACRPKS